MPKTAKGDDPRTPAEFLAEVKRMANTFSADDRHECLDILEDWLADELDDDDTDEWSPDGWADPDEE